MTDQHFWGCHLADQTMPDDAPRNAPLPENCWHCGTTTCKDDCPCTNCQDAQFVAHAVYHCPTCGRMWSYVQLGTIPGAGLPPMPDATDLVGEFIDFGEAS